jgi:hypothetical protein
VVAVDATLDDSAEAEALEAESVEATLEATLEAETKEDSTEVETAAVLVMTTVEVASDVVSVLTGVTVGKGTSMVTVVGAGAVSGEARRMFPRRTATEAPSGQTVMSLTGPSRPVLGSVTTEEITSQGGLRVKLAHSSSPTRIWREQYSSCLFLFMTPLAPFSTVRTMS